MVILSHYKNLTFYSFWLVGVAYSLPPHAFCNMGFINRPPTPNILICILLQISIEVKEMGNEGREWGILLNHTIAEHKRPLL